MSKVLFIEDTVISFIGTHIPHIPLLHSIECIHEMIT